MADQHFDFRNAKRRSRTQECVEKRGLSRGVTSVCPSAVRGHRWHRCGGGLSKGLLVTFT
jgi:hypothetical protein